MQRILYVATSNAGKLRDFAAATQAHGLTILPLPGLDKIVPPPEEEATFEGNARAKAVYYSRHLSGEIVVADDSGLEVNALDGAPGVRSARFAADAGFGTSTTLNADAENNHYLLDRLAGVAENDRRARYRCVLAAASDGKVVATGEGEVAGRILTSPRGAGGFGYDPLFYLPDLRRTMAEIDLETKHDLSHRGSALRALLEKLETIGLKTCG